jgi:CheY-like chemotaxis protein
MTAQRVLIVDDNKDAASSLGRLLTLLGHETHVVHDGPTALSAVPQFQPQVVFLDLGMPGMDGFETAAQMRAAPGGDRLSIVALTGWGEKEDRERTEHAGFAAHLIKPVNVDQLEAALKGLLPSANTGSS